MEGEEDTYQERRESFNVITFPKLTINKGMMFKGDEIMPNIRKRKNGLWECRIKKNYKSYSIYARNQAELKKKMKDLKNKLNLNLTIQKISFEEYYKKWLELYKKPFLEESTINHIILIVEKHILPFFGKKYINDINHEVIQLFLNKKSKSRTKEFIVTYMQAIFRKAFQEQIITKNPFNLIIKEKRIKPNKKAFTLEEQKNILKYTKTKREDIYELIKFYIITGVRRAEALNITKNNFLENDKLHIIGTKTDKADREIKLTKIYYNYLKNKLNDNNALFVFNKLHITKQFKTILENLNIQGSLHCLRHTYASNMYYLGANIKLTQEQMGHSSYAITADIYTNLQNKKINPDEIKSLYNNSYYIEN